MFAAQQQQQYVTVQLASREDAERLGVPGAKSVRLALTPADVSSLEELDTYLPGYRPFGGFRADEVAPISLRDKDVGKYRVFGLSNLSRRVHTEISLQSPVGEVDPETELAPYQMLPHGLGSFIPWETENAADFDLKRAAGERIKDLLSVDREYAVWSLLRNPNSWGPNNRVTLGAGFQWNGGVNSDPIADIQSRIRASTQPITDVYFSLATSHAFLNHNKVRDYMRTFYGDGAPGTNILRGAGVQAEFIDFSLPGLPPIHVAGATLQDETTGVLDGMIGGDVVLVSNPPGEPTNGERIQTVRTMRSRGPSGTGWTSREYFVNNRGLNGGTMILAGYTEVVVMVAPTTGGLIRNVIQ
ncbi:MAG: hypothetical protein ACOY0T_37530 [Myxococcota bacterium]